MGAKLFIGPPRMRNEVVLKIFWYGLSYEKCMVSMAIPYMIIMNGGRPTNSILSRVLLIIENYNCCQIKAQIHVIPPVVSYVNYLICIFMNTNENLKNEVKLYVIITYFSPKTSAKHDCCSIYQDTK